MRSLARAMVIVAAALLVSAAVWLVMQSNGAPGLLPGGRDGNQPGFRADFGDGQRPFEGEGGEFRGRPEGEHSGALFGLSGLVKNIVIFGIIFAGVMGFSIVITRLRPGWQAWRSEEKTQ